MSLKSLILVIIALLITALSLLAIEYYLVLGGVDNVPSVHAPINSK